MSFLGAIRMEAELFRTIIATLTDGVVVADTSGIVVFVNPAFASLFARATPGTPLLDGVAELTLASDPTAALADFFPAAKAAGGDHPPRVDVTLESTGVSLSVESRPLRDRAGARVGSLSVFRDVTPVRQSERELARVTSFLDSIVENIPDMVFVKDATDLRFERLNRAGEELLGISREELLGKTDAELFPEEQARFFQTRDRDTLLSGRLVDIAEEPIDTKQGQKWLHTKKITIRDERGVPRHLLGISSDITERRRTEEALKRVHEELERRVVERTETLRRTEEQLRHAQKLEAVGRLAGGVAHDFNNVLAVILGQIGLIEHRIGDKDPMRDDLAPIREAAQHAATLTRQLLAFSRKQVMEPRIVNLNRIVERTRNMLSRLLGEDVELVTRLSGGVGNILADPALIEQVIINLAVNARDAMPSGGVLVIETAQVTATGEHSPPLATDAGPHTLLRVSDTGVGMDAETAARIFEPFFTTKAIGHGTGLGLSMAYGVVTQSGGSIHVDSELGKGTSFRVYFPCTPHERSLTPSPAKVRVTGGMGETILVVEDETPLRKVLSAVLEQAGYGVIAARDGVEALSLAAESPGRIHLLLSDVVMPLIDGPELARRLTGSRPGIRVLFMSGYPAERLAGHQLSTDDAEDYLQKPFSPETLAARVRKALDS
jgi:PAS domain S-box-containing protein